MIARSQPMNRCRPPSSAIRSAPGERKRWKVLPRISSKPSPATSAALEGADRAAGRQRDEGRRLDRAVRRDSRAGAGGSVARLDLESEASRVVSHDRQPRAGPRPRRRSASVRSSPAAARSRAARARSARRRRGRLPSPSSRPRPVTTSGTGFSEWAVFGEPSGSSICSALPWSAVTMQAPPPRVHRRDDLAEARVDRLDRLDRRRDDAGVADHVGVGEVDDPEAVARRPTSARRTPPRRRRRSSPACGRRSGRRAASRPASAPPPPTRPRGRR